MLVNDSRERSGSCGTLLGSHSLQPSLPRGHWAFFQSFEKLLQKWLDQSQVGIKLGSWDSRIEDLDGRQLNKVMTVGVAWIVYRRV